MISEELNFFHLDCEKLENVEKKYFPFLEVKKELSENGDVNCKVFWAEKYKKILGNYRVDRFLSDNLCYQKRTPIIVNSPYITVPCNDFELLNWVKNQKAFYFSKKIENEYSCYFKYDRKIEKRDLIYIPPKLRRCKYGEDSGVRYENCCPSEEYDLIDFKNKIEKQNLKTEIKKEVIIPIDKPLEIEQMGLLESTIFGTFVVVKNLLK